MEITDKQIEAILNLTAHRQDDGSWVDASNGFYYTHTDLGKKIRDILKPVEPPEEKPTVLTDEQIGGLLGFMEDLNQSPESITKMIQVVLREVKPMREWKDGCPSDTGDDAMFEVADEKRTRSAVNRRRNRLLWGGGLELSSMAKECIAFHYEIPPIPDPPKPLPDKQAFFKIRCKSNGDTGLGVYSPRNDSPFSVSWDDDGRCERVYDHDDVSGDSNYEITEWIDNDEGARE